MTRILLTAGFLLWMLPSCLAQIPLPQIEFEGAEKYVSNGQPFVRYKLKVLNAAAFSPALFAPAPNLPPCGNNKNSSRSWVDIYSGTKRLYGFCALQALEGLWFALPASQKPPPWAYMILNDRQNQETATSNPVIIPSQ